MRSATNERSRQRRLSKRRGRRGAAAAGEGGAAACVAARSLLPQVARCLLAPTRCRRPRYAAASLAEVDECFGDAPQYERARLRAAEALKRGALPFPPAWALAATVGHVEDAVSFSARPDLAGYVNALPPGCLLAHALRCAAAPAEGDAAARLDALLENAVASVEDGDDLADCAAFLGEYAARTPAGPDAKRDAAFGACVARLNDAVLREFPASTGPARLALGLLLRPAFPAAVRSAVWREVGHAGNLAHLRVADVGACACSTGDAPALVDDVLLALRHDPPSESPVVAVARQHLAAFLEGEPEGTFQRNWRIQVLQESLAAEHQTAIGMKTRQ